jgi:hypothetical protein
MAEQIGSREEVRFPDIPHTAEAHEAYYADALEKIRSGETVWVQRGFDSDSGRVLDLFSDKKYRGFIEQEYDDMACDVYLAPADDPAGEPRRLNYQRVDVQYGAELLLSAVEAPESPPTPSGYGRHGH